MSSYKTTDFLRLRSTPEKDITGRNILDTMPPDTLVEKVEAANGSGWMKVRTLTGNLVIEGYVSEKYLQPVEDLSLPEPEIMAKTPTPVHLTTNRVISKKSIEGRAFPLNEPGLVKKDLSRIAGKEDRKTAIREVLNYLDVENSARYSPTTKNTYCNIYAYDVSYCLGAYLPRVWWQGKALERAMSGEKPPVIYGNTVLELNANSLTNWFENYGSAFGWKRLFDLTGLQSQANEGRLGIIVGQRMNLNFSGHIVAVVPENENHKAAREGQQVTSPLQSQAGVRNKKYFTANNWWLKADKFRKFGFWIWDV